MQLEDADTGETRVIRTSWVEVVVAGGVLLLVAFAVYGRNVKSGGLSSDDWSSLDAYRHLSEPGYWGLVESYLGTFGGKPLLPLFLAALPALFGEAEQAWLASAVVLGTATSLCFYALLRTVGLAPAHAGAVGVLTLIVPWSSSGRLWPAAAVNNLAICFFLIGLVVALRALPISGSAGRLRHACALLLYVASVLTYELAGTAAMAAGALYLGRSPRREALTRWATDVVVVAAALVWSAAATNKYIPPLEDQVRALPKFVFDGLRLLGDAVLPVGGLRRVGLVAFVVVLAVAVVAVRRWPESDVTRRLRPWLAVGTVGLVGAAASYVVLVPSAYYTPLSRGLENRVNMMAALPLTLLVYSTWIIAGTLLLRRLRPLVIAATAFVVLAGGNVVQLFDQQNDWLRAARLQDKVLSALRGVDAPPGSTVYVFGAPGTVSPRLPVFADTWDLNSAVRVVAEDGSLRGYPVFEGAQLVCESGYLEPQSLPGLHYDMAGDEEGPPPRYHRPHYGLDEGAPYGQVVFVDVASKNTQLVNDGTECVAALRRFVPGPLYE